MGGRPDLSSWVVNIAGQAVKIGLILNALISFVLTALVVYFFVVLPVNKQMDRYRPESLRAIPAAACRCRECGAQLEPPSEAVRAAMRQVAAPSGEAIADEAARALSRRLAGDNQ